MHKNGHDILKICKGFYTAIFHQKAKIFNFKREAPHNSFEKMGARQILTFQTPLVVLKAKKAQTS